MALLVNGEYLADRLFFEEFQRLQGGAVGAQASGQQLSVEVLRRAAENRVVQRELLRQMAIQAGFGVSASEIELEHRSRWGSSTNSVSGMGITGAIEIELLIAKISAHLTKHVFRPSRADVERFYKSNPARFYQPERLQVSHIVKNAEEASADNEAREILAKAEKELDAGKPFAKVADRYSDCPGTGGSLGWIVRGVMVEEFDEAVFGLKKNERSSIFRTVFGWHIVTVTAKRPAGLQPFEEVRPALAKGIYEARCQDTIAAAVADVARRSTIIAAPVDGRGPAIAEELTT